MESFLPYSNPPNDYIHIRINGTWYQEWQAGYHDILRKGYPKPRQKTTILAELHSPNTTDFLHGGVGDVPFLISNTTKAVLRKGNLTGFRFSRVEIVKVATKGQRARSPKHGEPEDQLLKATNQLSNLAAVPQLTAVRVCGRVEIFPEHAQGRCPLTRYVTPYDLPSDSDQPQPDLWRPTINGKTFAAWVYCSSRFRDIAMSSGLSNIGFLPFEEHMASYRKQIAGEIDRRRI